jgi:hypothetical protein
MKPEDAEAIFYQTYGTGMEWREVDKPLVQRDLQMKAWKAVIDAIVRETDAFWAARMLELMNEPARHSDR